MIAISVIYFIYLFVQLINYDLVNININKSIEDLDTVEAIQISNTKLSFAFKMNGISYEDLTNR